MRSVLFLVVAAFSMSACAMLPSPEGEVSYTANPTAKPNAPTTNKPTAIKVAATPATQAPVIKSQPISTAATTAALPQVVQSGKSDASIAPVVNVFIVNSNPATGQEVLIPVLAGTSVKSGDVLEYQGLFTNHGDRVRKMDVSLSIADGLELIGGVTPRLASGSLDGNRFTRMPVRISVNGQTQEAPLSRYKALRWTIEDVGIGGTAVVKYRAKVK